MVVAKVLMSEPNYFELLGLPQTFDLDRNALIHNYRQLQARLHPDNFAHAGAVEKRLAVQQSALINDALQTLKQPLSRAIYLLTLYDRKLDAQQSHTDSSFLIEQMQLREALEAIANSEQPQDKLDAFMDDLRQRIQSLTSEISGLFSSYQNEAQAGLLDQIESRIVKMQFLQKLLHNAQEMADSFDNY